MQKHQKLIYNTYKNLGQQYLSDISNLEPADLKAFVKLLPKNGTILDVGCAGGRDSARFAKMGFTVFGIDLVENFIKEARQLVPSGSFEVMDLLNIKLPKNHFDAIWAEAVLLHLEKKDIPKVLKSIFTILKKNGLIHIEVKKGKDTKIINDKFSPEAKRNFTFFYKHELEQFVKAAGFKIVRSVINPDPAKRKNLKWVCIWATKIK